MSWDSPWALAGLLLLPVLWWIYRRRRRPPTVHLPSLVFLEPEESEPPPRRRGWDPEAWLAVGALVAWVVAAAGPTLTVRPAGHTLRVVVSGGAAAGQTGYADRVDAVLARLRDGLGPADVLTVETVPDEAGAPRPDAGVLLDAAGPQGTVVSDAPPPDGAVGAEWVSVGRPDARNAGIVWAGFDADGTGLDLHATVFNQGGPRATELRLVERADDGADVLLRAQAVQVEDGYTLVTLEDVPDRPRLALRLVSSDASDALAADDLVAWDRSPLTVAIDDALPGAVREALRRGLAAAVGPTGWEAAGEDARLHVGLGVPPSTEDGAWRLGLFPSDASEATVAAGPDRATSDPLVRDLAGRAGALVFSLGANTPDGWTVLLLRRGTPDRPIVAAEGRRVCLLPDPLGGTPPLVDTPLWPLFLDNLVRRVAGHQEVETAGRRRRGLLDPRTSRLGTIATPPDPTRIGAGAPDRPPVRRPLGLVLAALGLALALAVWIRAARRAPRPRSAGASVPSPS